jgi:hypothetical protein
MQRAATDKLEEILFKGLAVKKPKRRKNGAIV